MYVAPVAREEVISVWRSQDIAWNRYIDQGEYA